MSVLQLFSNNAISLLQVSIGATDTVIQLQPGQGTLFPQPSLPGEFFLITLEDIANPTIREIVRVNNRIGDSLTGCVRAQEGTVAKAWVASQTLVDHRVTAETMRQAFLQPVPPPPTSGSGGLEYNPVTVEVAWTQEVATAPYTETHRGNKFWVSMVAPANGKAQHFEVLTVVNGLLSTNAETVTWTRTNRIGYNFLGQTIVTLDVIAKEVSVSWQNNEPLINVVVTVIRI